MKPKVIVMSHGNMAQETVNSAKMIVGELADAHVVSMAEEDGLSGTNQKLTAILATFSQTDEILILVDLKGGTPCNVALMQSSAYPNLRVVSGLNLAMLVESALSPLETSEELATFLAEIGKSAVEKLEPILEVEEDEELEYEE